MAAKRELTVPFELRGQRGLINVRVLPNDDPWASGHQLVAPDFDAKTFRGFPVCTATIRYHGQGINAWMGWVQLVTREYDGEVSVDVPPFLADAGPLYTYGHLPTFFDAPANPGHADGEWRADTFLVVVPDVIHSRRLEPVAGFSWGYRLTGGTPELLEPVRRDAASWSGHSAVLAARYPTWEFA
jgi:hypothetical protein